MKNPATIPGDIRHWAEVDMRRAADLQAAARQAAADVGRQTVIFRRSSLAFPDRGSRGEVARRIVALRRRLRDAGYDAGRVCAEFRDPDAFAFCDGGGATAADLR